MTNVGMHDCRWSRVPASAVRTVAALVLAVGCVAMPAAHAQDAETCAPWDSNPDLRRQQPMPTDVHRRPLALVNASATVH
jgi:hypothetical protein